MSAAIVNDGTLDWTGGQLQVRSDLGGNASITNNKTFNINVDNLMFWCCGSTQPALNNTATGTITKTGTGTLSFNGIAITNTGTIDNQAGTISFAANTTQTINGTYTSGIGATTSFNSGDGPSPIRSSRAH